MCVCIPNIKTPWCGQPGCGNKKQETSANENVGTQIVVDLFEMRATTLPYRRERYEDVENLHKYNFMNAVIAEICDKYNVTDRDIKEEIHKRYLASVQSKGDNI